MYEYVKVTDKGVERTIDFQGACLPDGRSIDGILNENEKLKQEIIELKEKSSLLSKLFPRKKIRTIIEAILLIFAILGIINIILRILEVVYH